MALPAICTKTVEDLLTEFDRNGFDEYVKIRRAPGKRDIPW